MLDHFQISLKHVVGIALRAKPAVRSLSNHDEFWRGVRFHSNPTQRGSIERPEPRFMSLQPEAFQFFEIQDLNKAEY